MEKQWRRDTEVQSMVPSPVMNYRQKKNFVDVHNSHVAQYFPLFRCYWWHFALTHDAHWHILANSWKSWQFNLSRYTDYHGPMGFRDYIYLLIQELAPMSIRLKGIGGVCPHQYDRCDHLIEAAPKRATARCAACQKNSTPGYWCAKCKVYLHAACFKDFHTRYTIILIIILILYTFSHHTTLTCCTVQVVVVDVFLRLS